MKRVILIVAILAYSLTFAQEKKQVDNKEKKHEVKLNAVNLIAFSWADVSYEYLINKESSFGSSVIFSLSEQRNKDIELYKNFSLTSYYRRFLSSKYAKGFFVEGFAMYNRFKDYEYESTVGGASTKIYKNGNDFTLGFSIGTKYVTKNGFAVEAYLGVGRNLIDKDDTRQIMPRGGVSVGYRF